MLHSKHHGSCQIFVGLSIFKNYFNLYFTCEITTNFFGMQEKTLLWQNYLASSLSCLLLSLKFSFKKIMTDMVGKR